MGFLYRGDLEVSGSKMKLEDICLPKETVGLALLE